MNVCFGFNSETTRSINRLTFNKAREEIKGIPLVPNTRNDDCVSSRVDDVFLLLKYLLIKVIIFAMPQSSFDRATRVVGSIAIIPSLRRGHSLPPSQSRTFCSATRTSSHNARIRNGSTTISLAPFALPPFMLPLRF